MHFSRIRPRDGADPLAVSWNMGKGEYEIHRMVWSLFRAPGTETRSFLYRKEDLRGPVIYCVSAEPPRDSTRQWSVETKPYDPQVAIGETLEFSLCANPVVSRRDDQGKQLRHDVVMDAKTKLREAGQKSPQVSALMQDACFQWMSRRAATIGVEIGVQGFGCFSYRVLRFRRPRNGNRISLGVVDLRGRLRVLDASLFRQALFHGVGHGKAFGCGLLMVRRP